jgi:hypothetical protein
MISVSLDSVYVNVGLPALGIGVLLGLFVMWLVARSRRNKLLRELADAEASLKNQEAIQAEREAAFDSRRHLPILRIARSALTATHS